MGKFDKVGHSVVADYYRDYKKTVLDSVYDKILNNTEPSTVYSTTSILLHYEIEEMIRNFKANGYNYRVYLTVLTLDAV